MKFRRAMVGLRRAAAVAAVGFVFAVVCSSCSRKTKAPIPPGKTVVTWMVGVDLTRDLIDDLAAQFNRENPRVHLNVQWVPGPHYQSKLKTLIAAGQPPDLFYCGDVWVAYLLPFLYDVTPFMERDAAEMNLDDFYPQLLAACRHNGRYYFLPRWFNVSLLYYNKTLFRDAGVAFPTADWTWDDYVKAGEKLTQGRTPEGRADVWGSTISAFWWGEWLTLVRQSGGDMFDTSVTRCLLDTPEAKRGMQFFYDKIYKYHISPPPGFEPDLAFASKKMAMEFGGHTGNWVTYNAIDGLDWDIEMLPAGPATRRGGELAVDALGISKSCKNPEAAWEVVKFMSSKESIRRHVEKGFLSVRRSVAEEVVFERAKTRNPRNVAAAYKALDFAVPVPRQANFIELALEVVQPDIDEMMTGKLNPSVTCDRVTEAANAYLRVVSPGGAAR